MIYETNIIICHKDLKPENILICKKLKNCFNLIKVIDFGTTIIFNKDKNNKSLTGSVYHKPAPEARIFFEFKINK